ncbi:hypothetical protein ACIN8IBEIGE_90046 [Acinetobacter sp. 8I-beige]|nr:hypothetical protein ACIN8IBEIGE_90046 [Acinetobacter sp. 8I-beige]
MHCKFVLNQTMEMLNRIYKLNEYVKDYKQNELDESNMDWSGGHCIMEFNYCSD